MCYYCFESICRLNTRFVEICLRCLSRKKRPSEKCVVCNKFLREMGVYLLSLHISQNGLAIEVYCIPKISTPRCCCSIHHPWHNLYCIHPKPQKKNIYFMLIILINFLWKIYQQPLWCAKFPLENLHKFNISCSGRSN